MKIATKIFGNIDIGDEKIIEFPKGIIGFEECRHFVLMHGDDGEKEHLIKWLQSVEDGELAFPVIDPLKVNENYNPIVEDELLKVIGQFELEDLYVLTVATVPKDIEKMTVNLKAPVIINIATMKGIQLIVDNEEYSVRQSVYNLIKARKEKAGE